MTLSFLNTCSNGHMLLYDHNKTFRFSVVSASSERNNKTFPALSRNNLLRKAVGMLSYRLVANRKFTIA